MRFNLIFFILLFLVFSFFITLNLFFERSFQREALELTHKELGLLTQNLSEKLSFLLNVVPNRYNYWKVQSDSKEKLKVNEPEDLYDLFYKDLSSLINLQVEFTSFEISSKEFTSNDLMIEVNPHEKKLYYKFPVQIKNKYSMVQIEISLDELFQKHLKPIQITERGYAWLISREGILLYHPTQPKMAGNNIFGDTNSCMQCHKSFEAERTILRSEIVRGYQYYYSPEKEDKIIYYSMLPVYNQEWVLCISVPYNEILAYLNKSMKFHSLIVISVFLTLIIVGTFFYLINVKRIAAEEKVKFFTFLYSIIESTQSKLVVVDNAYKILLANTAYANLLKRNKEDLAGRNFFENTPPTEEEFKIKLLELTKEACNGKFTEFIGFPLMENGNTRYYHLTINPLKEGGEIIGAVITFDDISEEIFLREKLKKYTEELEKIVDERTRELKEEKEKLSIIMNSINTGIAILDEKGKILWMNPKMRDLFRLCLMEEAKEGISIYSFSEKLPQTLEISQPLQFIEEKFCHNKRLVIQVQITPIFSEGSEIKYICLVQDITDLKLMEERIMQSEKLQALARISAGLAHEIGNPLTSISSYVQVLREMNLGDFANQALDVISKHIIRISEIIRNISSFSKPSKGEVIPTDVNEVLEGSLNLVKFDKRIKDVKIIKKIEEVPKVLVDPNQLSQVFINIILNAGDAMPQGGELLIETKVVENFVEISFTDTGVGIPLEHLPFIFDPFFTTKEKGTGFGLAVSYSIIKNFGGDILVRSEMGKGSTFSVRLPVYEMRGE